MDASQNVFIAGLRRTDIDQDFPSPWHNADQPKDVSGDGHVSPRDVLFIINYLNGDNAARSSGAQLVDEALGFLDVNSDWYVTALDALLVINAINSAIGEGEHARESTLPSATSHSLKQAVDFFWESEFRTRYRRNLAFASLGDSSASQVAAAGDLSRSGL